MWQRTKRLINSYLDDLINRASSPDRDVRQITRAELSRLNQLEADTRASVKMLEKELAETELQLIGVAEREKMARASGDQAGVASATSDMVALTQHIDFLKKQILEANATAEKARRLREERAKQGQELANETYLTEMRENLASVQSPFDATDPSSTLDEMRSRIRGTGIDDTALRVAEADREMEAERARARADELLAKYKAGLGGAEKEAPKPDPPVSPKTESSPINQVDKEDDPEQPKTLGPAKGQTRPID
ncbi:MAG TPA: hypothetical protein VID27_12105 [Blastocatellia bacterium]|jgi:hypothetical protein